MKTSELMKHLCDTIILHGDIEVRFMEFNNPPDYPSYYDDREIEAAEFNKVENTLDLYSIPL